MHFVKHFIFKTIKYNLINKFTYKSVKKLPKLKKIILNFGFKTTEMKQLSKSLLAIELIAGQKGIITTTKYSNIHLKIRKGCPAGCKITLKKSNKINFLTNILINTIQKTNNFGLKIKNKKSVFSCRLKEIYNFKELKKNYNLFYDMPKLDITFIINAKNSKEIRYFLKLLPFLVKNKKQQI